MSDITLHNRIEGLHKTIDILVDLNRRLTEQRDSLTDDISDLHHLLNQQTEKLRDADAIMATYTNTRSGT